MILLSVATLREPWFPKLLLDVRIPILLHCAFFLIGRTLNDFIKLQMYKVIESSVLLP